MFKKEDQTFIGRRYPFMTVWESRDETGNLISSSPSQASLSKMNIGCDIKDLQEMDNVSAECVGRITSVHVQGEGYTLTKERLIEAFQTLDNNR